MQGLQLILIRTVPLAAVMAVMSCASRHSARAPDNPILGEWVIPAGMDMSAGQTLVSDTIDLAAVRGQMAKDLLKWNHVLDQSLQFKANGSGVYREAARGSVRFTYSCECDASKAFPQMVDSAGYYVEDPSSPLVPCDIHIADAVYGLLREPGAPLRDTVQFSRQLWVGGTLVSEQYFFMVRKSD